MIRIFLTGYMGAGKTTLGKAFAREMNVPFIDLDWYIEERFHKSIRELFTERGEASFRELERNMLHEVGEFEDVVVSTGGGTPCFFDNMEYMNGCGQTVFLDVHPDILFPGSGWRSSNAPSCKARRTKICAPSLWRRWISVSLSTRRPVIALMPVIWKAAARLANPCNGYANF